MKQKPKTRKTEMDTPIRQKKIGNLVGKYKNKKRKINFSFPWSR